MNDIIYRNLANAIVGLRVILVFVLIALLETESLGFRIIGLILLIIIALLDWVDGFVAAKCNIVSKLGAMLDTLGDRITENLLFIYFAYKQVLPVYVPLFFITRSFLADFIRSLNFQKGLTTFSVNDSFWGKVFVSSRFSRALYLCMKIAVAVMCAVSLVLELLTDSISEAFILNFNSSILIMAILTVWFSLIRFICLVYDSRHILGEAFFE